MPNTDTEGSLVTRKRNTNHAKMALTALCFTGGKVRCEVNHLGCPLCLQQKKTKKQKQQKKKTLVFDPDLQRGEEIILID